MKKTDNSLQWTNKVKTIQCSKFGWLSNKHIGAVALMLVLWMGTATASLAQQETITEINKSVTTSLNTVDCTGLAIVQVDINGDQGDDTVCMSDNNGSGVNLSSCGTDGNGGNLFCAGTTGASTPALPLVAGANVLVATSYQLHGLQSSPVTVFSSGGGNAIVVTTIAGVQHAGPDYWGGLYRYMICCLPTTWTHIYAQEVLVVPPNNCDGTQNNNGPATTTFPVIDQGVIPAGWNGCQSIRDEVGLDGDPPPFVAGCTDNTTVTVWQGQTSANVQTLSVVVNQTRLASADGSHLTVGANSSGVTGNNLTAP